MNNIKEELKKYRTILINLLKNKEYKELTRKLTQICSKFCLPPRKNDRSIFTPYEEGVYNTGEYVNYSVISYNKEKKYIAASNPREGNIKGFTKLFRHTDIIISCINKIKYVEAPLKSTPVKLNGKIIFYDELYEKCRILRFENWVDHDVLDQDEFDEFYKYYKTLNIKVPLVHCHAGVGRTGFFIMYDILYGKKVTAEEFVDILIDLRSQRNGLVYSCKQMKLLSDIFI